MSSISLLSFFVDFLGIRKRGEHVGGSERAERRDHQKIIARYTDWRAVHDPIMGGRDAGQYGNGP